jgi:2-polyprenyl-3-methyl-5-hydroxy-6-metoxy-1,4-benzoquinol methylase
MSRPDITIVLPVRNGGRHLKESVASVLAQRAGSFELVVLDNDSSDGSPAWLAGIDDPRLRVSTSPRKLSIEESFERIRAVKRAPLMTVVGHDDVLDSDFLEVMLPLAAEHPASDLFHAHFRLIDDAGATIRPCRPIPERESAAQFAEARLEVARDSFGTGYVMRSAAFDAARGFPAFPSLLYADDALFMRLSLRAPKITSPRSCFRYRLHAGSASGSARGADLFAGLLLHLDALNDAARGNGELAAMLARRGPALLLRLFKHHYRMILIDADRRGEQLDEATRSALIDALRARNTALADAFARSSCSPLSRVFFHERLNRSPLGRVAVASLAEPRAARGDRTCLSCGAVATYAFTTKDHNRHISGEGFSYYACTSCGVLSLQPVADDIGSYYPKGYHFIPTRSQLEEAARAEQYKIDLIKPFAPRGRLLEIGPASGYFAFAAKQAGYDVDTIEMDEECCRFLRDVIGVRAHHDMDVPRALTQAGPFDVIALWHVIEHLVDPWRTLAAAAARLTPGGVLAVATPNPAAVQFRVLGTRWSHIDAPRHVMLIPHETLIAHARNLSLAPLLVTTSDEGARGWNRFGWETSLADLGVDRISRAVLRRVGRAVGHAIAPLEERGLAGSTYTVLLGRGAGPT